MSAACRLPGRKTPADTKSRTAAWNSVRVPVSTWSTADMVLSPQPTKNSRGFGFIIFRSHLPPHCPRPGRHSRGSPLFSLMVGVSLLHIVRPPTWRHRLIFSADNSICRRWSLDMAKNDWNTYVCRAIEELIIGEVCGDGIDFKEMILAIRSVLKWNLNMHLPAVFEHHC